MPRIYADERGSEKQPLINTEDTDQEGQNLFTADLRGSEKQPLIGTEDTDQERQNLLPRICADERGSKLIARIAEIAKVFKPEVPRICADERGSKLIARIAEIAKKRRD